MGNVMIPGYVKFLGFIAVLIIIYYIRNAWDSHEIREESGQLTTQAVDTVTASWSEADFRKFQDPYQNVFFVNSVQQAGLAQALASYARLGKRTAATECTLDNFTTYKNEKENYVAANYLCQGQYQNGAARIIVAVRRFAIGGAWKISYFDVTSPTLARKK